MSASFPTSATPSAPTATMVEELLTAWRAGERVLEALPASDPVRPEVAEAVATVRLLSRRMTAAEDVSEAKLETSQKTIENALAVINDARERLGQASLPTEEP